MTRGTEARGPIAVDSKAGEAKREVVFEVIAQDEDDRLAGAQAEAVVGSVVAHVGVDGEVLSRSA